MPTPAETAEKLVKRYPQFADINQERLEAFAEDALDYLPEGITGSRASQALMCKAGSLLIESLKLKLLADGTAGQVKRMKEGELELEFFASPAAAALANSLEAQFEKLTAQMPDAKAKRPGMYTLGAHRRPCQ